MEEIARIAQIVAIAATAGRAADQVVEDGGGEAVTTAEAADTAAMEGKGTDVVL